MSDTWGQAVQSLAETLESLRPGQFVIVEYDAGAIEPLPYAQAARELESFHCEVVSEYFLPREFWPIISRHLELGGWNPPTSDGENWWRTLSDASEAALALVIGLRDGRVCRDPSRFAVTVGTFPPGPDGGEPVPLDEAPLSRAA